MNKEEEEYFTELSRKAEVGELVPSGPVLRGVEAQAEARAMLLAASGFDSVEALIDYYRHDTL